MLEIRLLGRFEVVADGAALALGGHRQRAVLAVLAVHANEIVSMDRLVDEVWGGAPPPTATATLQRYVSHLRDALADVAIDIETRRPGYLLRVDPHAIDVRRFEQLLERGRRAFVTGDAAVAARVLRDALALWRGEPLADFSYEPFARVETSRLEELRWTARDLRIEADLALGCHSQLVPELEALVAAHPLRESCRGQLMRALHGAGRRADALRVYSEGRRVLAEELGLDPSNGLEQLERAILLKDPAVEPPAVAAQAVKASHLPAELTSFVGRGAEVEEVQALLRRSRLVTLTGVGGSGKSRLALRVASEEARSPAGGCWLVELGAVADPALVARAIAGALGIRGEADRPILDTVVDALRAEHSLLVIDGCEHLLDGVAPIVDRILTMTRDVRLLVTSREVLDVVGEAVYRVPPLPAADAQRLFRDRAGAADAAFRAGEDEEGTIGALCERLDGLPLAIELAAARVDVLTPAQLLAKLDRRFDVLRTERRGGLPRHRALLAAVEWSYELLSDVERVLFERLSVFAGTFTLETAEAICAGPPIEGPEVFDVLSRLVRKSLVVRADGGRKTSARFRLLDTLREYASLRLCERGAWIDAHRRHAAYFTAKAELAKPHLHGPGAAAVLDELEVYHPEIRAALGWLLDQGDAGGACRLALVGATLWDARWQIKDGSMWLERTRALAAQHNTHPTRDQIAVVVEAAYFASQSDDFATAIERCDEAFALLELTPDDWVRARALAVRGELARFADEPLLAEQLCEEAMAVAAQQGDAWNAADASRIVTLAALDRGDAAKAAVAAEQCLAFSKTCGDIEKVAGSQTLVATLARERGELEVARELFEDSLSRFQQMGEQIGIYYALFRLSEVSNDRGDHASAITYAGEAARVAEEAGHARGVAMSMRALADATLLSGDLQGAARWCDGSIALFRARGFGGDLIQALVLATRIELAREDLDAALAACDEGLRLERDRGYGRYTDELQALRRQVSAARRRRTRQRSRSSVATRRR